MRSCAQTLHFLGKIVYIKAMLNYLVERENEEMFRTTVRSLTFPDGETCRIEAYRLVWSWYDRLIAYEFGPDEDRILTLARQCSAEEDLPLSDALGRVVNYLLESYESMGLDVTDDPLELNLAQQPISQFHNRKAARRS